MAKDLRVLTEMDNFAENITLHVNYEYKGCHLNFCYHKMILQGWSREFLWVSDWMRK